MYNEKNESAIFRHFAEIDENGFIGGAYGFLDEGNETPPIQDGYVEITELYENVDFEELQERSIKDDNFILAVRDGKVCLVNPYVFEEGM